MSDLARTQLAVALVGTISERVNAHLEKFETEMRLLGMDDSMRAIMWGAVEANARGRAALAKDRQRRPEAYKS